MKQFKIYLTVGQWQVIKTLASTLKKSKSEITREALQDYAGKHGVIFPEESIQWGGKRE